MPVDKNPFPYRDFLHPKHWPTWLGLALLWCCSRLPYTWNMALGNMLGLLGFYLLPGRRRITRTNIRLCFPELDKRATRQLVRQNFQSTTLALFESALSWWAPESRMKKLYRVEGLEHLREAQSRGKGVLMIGGHYTTLEISGLFLSYLTTDVYPTYKPAHNPLFEAVMAHSRRRIHAGLVASRDMRTTLKTLKNNKIIWYAPDQDFGMASSVFAPFMGIATATLTLTARIAQKSNAAVLAYSSERLPDNKGYVIRFGPILENFPTGDDVKDATTINEVIEQGVRAAPEQYLWGHRRFKTRPWGEPPLYAPRRDTAMKRYSLLLFALAIPAIAHTLYIAIKTRDINYLKQRLGFSSYGGHADMWVHAASVGEVNAILPLLELIINNHPGLSITLTTNTPGGYLTASKKFTQNIQVYFLPFDWLWSVKRFINNVAPAYALITETELWPNLYTQSHWEGIKMITVNGRLSERSIHASRWKRTLLCKAIQLLYFVLARSETDKARFIDLCAKDEHVKVLGNIKFSAEDTTTSQPITLVKPYLLAASTRDNEESIIVSEFLKTDTENLLLVIVPRHPKRLKAILNDLEKYNLDTAVRSRNDVITDSTRIYIADTFGELNQFIAGAEFVIMGGSFKPFGGQNIIEVARAGKAVIFGPHMKNFSDEARLFKEYNACLQVNDSDELGTAISQLINNSELRQQLGQNGKNLTEKYKTIGATYYAEIKKLLNLI